jgi:hypothetical protein
MPLAPFLPPISRLQKFQCETKSLIVLLLLRIFLFLFVNKIYFACPLERSSRHHLGFARVDPNYYVHNTSFFCTDLSTYNR